MPKLDRKYIIFFAVAFLCGGILHALLSDVDFTDCFTQLFYSVLVLSWGVTISRRITDSRVRRIISLIIFFMEMYFLLQICKYRMFMGAERILWLAYYIPMLIIPLLLFFLSLYLNCQEDENPDKRWRLVSVPALMLITLVLTNDFHLLFSRIDGSARDITLSDAGIVFYMYWGYVILLLISSLFIMLRKCKISVSKSRAWILSLTLVMCAAMFLIYIAGLRPKIRGIYLWNIGEIFAFSTICIIEACIQSGLIPANTNYKWIFQKTNIPAVIKDANGECVYATEGANEILHPSEDVYIQTAPISGGSVSWMVDLSTVHALNRQIEDVTEQIKARNDYLKTQNSLQEERTAVDARNKVYDRIARIVRSQLIKIDELLQEGTENDFSQRLRKIAVFNAYIKRRSNLELLRESGELLPVSEVTTAIAESAEYLKLNSIDVVFNSFAEGQISANTAILAYEFFETVAEIVLENAKMLSTIFSCRDDIFSLRMVINSADFPFCEDWRQDVLSACNGKVSVIRNDGDTILVLRFERGGESQ